VGCLAIGFASLRLRRVRRERLAQNLLEVSGLLREGEEKVADEVGVFVECGHVEFSVGDWADEGFAVREEVFPDVAFAENDGEGRVNFFADGFSCNGANAHAHFGENGVLLVGDVDGKLWVCEARETGAKEWVGGGVEEE
jgi:hypothetical protein